MATDPFDEAGLKTRSHVQTAAGTAEPPDIELRHVSLAFDDKVVLKDVSFTLLPGHTKLILGASGSGKSTILKLILGLLKPDAGEVLVHGERVDRMEEPELLRMRGDLGMVFQEGALFDSLTVGENVGFKFYEDTDMPLADVRRRVEEVLGFVRLGDYVDRRTSELSGGQRRRVAIARAMASKPGLLLYDEATTGLDPITAITVDEEIVKLRDLEGVSSIVVTHQLRDAFFVATHGARRADGQAAGDKIVVAPADAAKADEAEFIMLKEGLVAFEGNAAELRASADPYIRTFLS
jgi:phospholipid/cholesterol/gamma-HCH transport system ATP-binding protein